MLVKAACLLIGQVLHYLLLFGKSLGEGGWAGGGRGGVSGCQPSTPWTDLL